MPPIRLRELARLPSVRAELGRRAAQVAVGAAIGWPFGHAALGALVVALWTLLVYFRYLVLLRGWAQHTRRVNLPDARGLWGGAYDLLIERNEKSRRRKRQLQRILAEFQASTAVLPDGAVVMSERGEIAWFNTSAQALLGLRTPQDVGLRVANLVRHPSFTRYFEAGDFSAEVEVPSPVNAGVALSLRVIPYGNGQKLLIVRDVSERKRLEEMRRDFVANASHELRTPLTVLRGYLEVLEPETRGGGPLSAWGPPVAEMRNQAARMEALINDLLKLARLESDFAARPEVVDVPRLIRSALDSARALSKGQHRFEQDIQSGLQLVGREAELQSIFANLVQNAVQYTPAGGSIRVSWRDDPAAGGAGFAVADTGIGIDAADIPRLTERFYRVDVARSRATGGTGLGLSIVKHALEQHEARLEVESEPRVGSTFTCRFPPHRVVRAPVAPELSQTVR